MTIILCHSHYLLLLDQWCAVRTTKLRVVGSNVHFYHCIGTTGQRRYAFPRAFEKGRVVRQQKKLRFEIRSNVGLSPDPVPTQRHIICTQSWPSEAVWFQMSRFQLNPARPNRSSSGICLCRKAPVGNVQKDLRKNVFTLAQLQLAMLKTEEFTALAATT